MSRYKRITLYYNMEDSQDGLRYSLINSLAARKKSLFDKMLDTYLETYGISNIEELTLKDLQEISKMLMGKEEVKEKRGRGRPRKVVEPVVKEEPKLEKEANEIKEKAQEEILIEANEEVEVKKERMGSAVTVDDSEMKKQEIKVEETKEENIPMQQLNKVKNPMSINIDDEDDEDEDGIDPALLGELDAFNF